MDDLSLSPSQADAFADLRTGLKTSPVAAFVCDSGLGRTTVMRALHRELGGAYLTIKDFLEAQGGRPPFALGESFERMLLGALARPPAVFVDDLHLLTDVTDGCMYPKRRLIDAPLTAAVALA